MRKCKGSLTVEAALLLPIIVLLIVPFIEIMRTAVAFVTVRTALFDCADRMADYGFLYESVGLLRLHQGLEEEERENAIIDGLEYISEETMQEIIEQSEIIEQGVDAIFDILRGDSIRHALAENMYPFLLNQAGKLAVKEMMKNELKESDLEKLGIRGGIKGMDFSGTKILYQQGEHSALIRVQVSYYPIYMTGKGILGQEPVSITATVHAFLGANVLGRQKTEDRYYRIGQGKKYHNIDCYLIDKDIQTVEAKSARRKGLDPCTRCGAENIAEEETVWYTIGGEAFHRIGCSYLRPELAEVTREQIEEEDWQPCELCLGNGGGFG